MAEGEFALVRKHLTTAASKPVSARGLFVNDTQLNFMLADLAVLERDEAALQQVAPLAAQTAQRDGHVLYQASAQRALGVLRRLKGDHVEAELHLLRALQMFEELETRWQYGRTLAELGEVAAAKTEYFLARDYYTRAMDAFAEMGARPDRERAQAALSALG